MQAQSVPLFTTSLPLLLLLLLSSFKLILGYRARELSCWKIARSNETGKHFKLFWHLILGRNLCTELSWLLRLLFRRAFFFFHCSLVCSQFEWSRRCSLVWWFFIFLFIEYLSCGHNFHTIAPTQPTHPTTYKHSQSLMEMAAPKKCCAGEWKPNGMQFGFSSHLRLPANQPTFSFVFLCQKEVNNQFIWFFALPTAQWRERERESISWFVVFGFGVLSPGGTWWWRYVCRRRQLSFPLMTARTMGFERLHTFIYLTWLWGKAGRDARRGRYKLTIRVIKSADEA